jgi:serine/threonine-protein kinase
MQCPACQTQVDASQRFCPACGIVLAAADAQVPDAMIGQSLGGKYKVVRLLGEGGMGAVYEGEQQLGTTRRKVAVKMLHPHLSRDPKIKARFEREVGTVAELEHPNTIHVYDFGANEDGILYIVMEFLQGKSLANLLEKEGAMLPDRVESCSRYADRSRKLTDAGSSIATSSRTTWCSSIGLGRKTS